MRAGERRLTEWGVARVILTVGTKNEHARRLYERCGYAEVARSRKVKEDWPGAGTDWVLLVKPA